MGARPEQAFAALVEGQDIWIRAQVTRGLDDTFVPLASIERIGLQIFDEDQALVHEVPNITPIADYFYDIPRTAGWDGPAPGFNFRYPIRIHSLIVEGTRLEGGKTYAFEWRLDRAGADGTSGGPYFIRALGFITPRASFPAISIKDSETDGDIGLIIP